jgi:hypothetical protein
MKLFNRAILLTIIALNSLSTASLHAKKDNTHLKPNKSNSSEYEYLLQESHITAPREIAHVVEPTRTTLQNILLSTGPTNTTLFSNPSAINNGIRDSHTNDAYNGHVAWAWTDNATISNKTNGTMNVMVAVGTINANGVVQIGHPINITNFTQGGLQAWDTAVAINRSNPNNIVVSYLLINYNTGTALPYRAYTTNGGTTWTNGPMNVPPAFFQEVGDNRGVASDKYGNIWYLATNLYNSSGTAINQPYFAVSSNGGQTFRLAYTVPLLSDFHLGVSEYDYPQFCFGGLGDGSGAYGLWFAADYYQNGSDITPIVGFIHINGANSIGTGSTIELINFKDTQYIPSLTASANGRVWCEGMNFLHANATCPVATRYKAPGAISANYQGPWTITTVSSAFIDGNVHELSQPDDGYFNVTVQGNVYDESRQALYSLVTDQVSNGSQNIYIHLYISRTNGQTWSAPINISTTTTANRGFASMALDSVTGDLVLGWYDGRNDSTFKSVEYYASVIPAATLTSLVNATIN